MSFYTPPDSPLSTRTLLDDDADYTIRALTSSDIPAARHLFVKLYPTASPPTAAHLTRLFTHPARAVLLAFSSSDSHTPVGVLAAARHDPSNDIARAAPVPARLDVLALGVLPAHRRRGLATRLVRAAAKRLGARRVRAEVTPREDDARAFWKNVGCDEEEEVRPWRVGALGVVVRAEGDVDL